MGIRTNAKIKQKADKDYEKRCADPLGANPATTTYIFVTPRRWSGKEQWITAKQVEGIWQDVKAYDADDLETWLHLAPGVHIQFSTLLGKQPQGARALLSFWADWSEATMPVLSSGLIVAGRQDSVERVLAWLNGESTSLALQAESRYDAVAFLASAIQHLPPEQRDAYFARSIVVEDLASWLQLAVIDATLVLIPIFDVGDAIRGALRQGHHVFIPLGTGDIQSSTTVEVPRLRRQHARAALLDMGLSEARATDLSMTARRSMMALRRKLAVNPEVQRPAWARANEAQALFPAILAGAWNDAKSQDRDAVAKLGTAPYPDMRLAFVRWAAESDAPVRRISNIWLLVSKEDAWTLLARFLSRDDLEKFERVVLEVLGELDPSLELPTEQRWQAALLNRTLSHSSLIRDGLADTLALMGARSASTTFIDAASGQEWASRIVRKLLSQANDEGRLWSSLSSTLPLLAEAAPDAFLEAVTAGLSGTQPVLMSIFSESNDPLSSSSSLTHLLWALETLAWKPDYLSQASLLLAKLARLDPGGKLTNRPKNSLRELYRCWHPQTTADLDQRLRVLDMLRKKEPQVAWALMCRLLPDETRTVSLTASPTWREWTPEVMTPVPLVEQRLAAREIAKRLLEDVGADNQRWPELINLAGNIPEEQFNVLVGKLLTMDDARINVEGKLAIWNTLRAIIFKHRQFGQSSWAMPSEQIAQLEEVYKRFAPDDIVSAYAWLFDRAPALLELSGPDWQRRSDALVAARFEAIRTLYNQGGLPTILTMSECVERPSELGASLGQSELLMEQEDSLLGQELSSSVNSRRTFALGFVVGRMRKEGWDWAEKKLMTASAWTTEQCADFLQCLPFEGRTWDRIETMDAETQRSYWTQVSPYGLMSADGCERVVGKFNQYNRPYASVYVIAVHSREQSPAVPPAMIADVLEQAARSSLGQDGDWQSVAEDISNLLNVVETSGEVDEARVAQLEWAFLPLSKYQERPRTILHRELSSSPDFFAEVIAFVFQAENEEQRELSDDERARVRRGADLLNSWRSVPGSDENGRIDPATLRSWISRAREATYASGRGSISDKMIGQVFAFSPHGTDGAWPVEVIRDVIEESESPELEESMMSKFLNSGTVSKALMEGGSQERQLSAMYERYASMLSASWPRTSVVLRKIAKYYESEARRFDVEAELREDVLR